MPVRVLDGSGSGSNANVAAGFAYACSHGASIVNASLGGAGYSTAMRDAIASPACANTLFVVAAGNDGENDDTTPHYPCNYGAPPDNLAERDLRRGDRPERRAGELLELRPRASTWPHPA